MSSDKKVVNIRLSTLSSEGQLPSVLDSIYSRGWQYLSDHVQKLLDNADDALFELADRALNAGEQNLYFEAMREIRVHRRRLEEEFRSQLLSPFHALLGADKQAGSSVLPLELLDYDDMEEQVAVESMASKASKRFTPRLATLARSLEAWSEANGAPLSLSENQLPLGPLLICDAFAKASRNLDISIKPRLVLFKLFDRHVVSEFAGLYTEFEASLKTSGFYVLGPKSKESPAGNMVSEGGEALPDSQGLEGQPVGADDSDESCNANLFDVLKSLLTLSSVGAQDQTQCQGAAPDGAIQLSRSSLMSVLQELQGSQLERLAVRGTHGMKGEELTALPSDLAERLRGVSREIVDGADETLAQRDFDIINLVSLLFQYILEDESLAGPMKGLIAHMQIPVLKAAMLDKRFFSKEGHPARLLLNTIADACLGWQSQGDCEDDPLYIEVESLVKHVLSAADGSPYVFQEALDDFKHYLEQERRKAEIVTKRVLDAHGGKDAAKMARNAVEKLLKDKLGSQPVPDALRALMEDGWSKVLYLQYVQQGEDGEAWKAAVTLVDNILWSVEPVSGAAHRHKLLSELPLVLEQLRNGLNQIGYNPFDLKAQLQQLEEVHLNRLRKVGDAAAEPVVEELTAVDEADHQDIDLDQLDASRAKSLGEMETLGEKELEEASRRLSRLQVGTWVEFQVHGAKSLRCRLAAVITSTGRHIFVNRSGMKVAEHEKDALVRMLATDGLALLDDGMLFDRALESVISNLRDMKGKPI
jgi:hypothetical protein